MKSLILFALVLLAPISVSTQTPESSADWRGLYEPNPAQPFGRLNPAAPKETAQFAFMIGEFDCTDEIIDPRTGKWAKMPAIWNARYFLNGHGIQDQYWSPGFATSNLRLFDQKSSSWKVTFFRMPNYAPSAPWEGKKEGEKMVMRKGDDKKGTRLTFYGINENGFEWIGENMVDGKGASFWKSSCKRRR